MGATIWRHSLIIIAVSIIAIGSLGCEGKRAADPSQTSAPNAAQPTAVSSSEKAMPSAATTSPPASPQLSPSNSTELKAIQELEVQSDLQLSEDTRNKVDKQQLAVDCGKLAFRKGEKAAEVQLPLICIRASYGADDPSHPTTVTPKMPLKTVSYSTPSALQEQLAAYWMNLGDNVNGVLLLAPKDWKVASGEVGANGSSAIRLESPDDPEQFIAYMDSGGCQGCITPNIGAYFPKLRDWSEEQGFTPDSIADMKQQSLLNPNLMAYSKKPKVDGYELNGVAYQEHGGGGGIFRKQEVQLPAAKHGSAQVMLNLFIALNRGSEH
ncbi:DUF4850 domain-containing protein [Paenibacillus radicis (ex Xue et al. 2023)]|uniref:DUF4850 domain-containing protein n=1 Tax=Paenibacillus radicis (ex Xue et al. 2023) TaxID=2972489 RepID=A0ABT1YRA2_9BACL|nr:DUF4850 domain-containing protein [Paenibacillus radicis (ex Xue et al. 2023)]MCR8635709.1 DUF4850 domain-containing protein [Paenibacillus radicis (ex Xue et al. 2023)]